MAIEQPTGTSISFLCWWMDGSAQDVAWAALSNLCSLKTLLSHFPET